MTNIKNNNYRKIDCCIINDNYIDLMISKDDIKHLDFSDNCFAAKLKFSNVTDRHVVSDVAWEKSVKSNNILENIGYTGVDNGFILYERDRIGNDEFLELYTNSEFDLSTFNDKFFVTEVNGNNHLFLYPIEKNEDYVSLKGGFYQGFFKIYGDEYQTLPHRIKNEWNFNITLKPRDYELHSNILNNRESNNSGIFFFIGCRAENKFFELYKKMENISDFLYINDDYCLDYDMIDYGVINEQYINENNLPAYTTSSKDEVKDTPIDEIIKDDEPKQEEDSYEQTVIEPTTYSNIYIPDDYFSEWDNPFYEKEISYGNYFLDDYMHNEIKPDDSDNNGEIGGDSGEKEDNIEDNYETIYECVDSVFEDDYLLPQIDLSNIILTDSNNNKLSEKGFYEFKTDNKFIIFNQTSTGYTKNSWNDMYEFMITGKTDAPNINYYPYLNRTSTGYTKDNIHELIEEYSYAYDVLKDIENNALAFKINEDGSISYRYLSTNCELIEETSLPNLVKKDEWNKIHLKIKRKPSNECDDYNEPAIMQIYIYVNGYLKLVSKELPELMLKPLNDNPQRQEGVPYSLSIGGGSQGLCERILLNYYDKPDYLLPIEKYFCGTFIGDIKEFNFITCPINHTIISKEL